MKTTTLTCCHDQHTNEIEIGYDMQKMRKEYFCCNCGKLAKVTTYNQWEWEQLQPWKELDQ